MYRTLTFFRHQFEACNFVANFVERYKLSSQSEMKLLVAMSHKVDTLVIFVGKLTILERKLSKMMVYIETKCRSLECG